MPSLKLQNMVSLHSEDTGRDTEEEFVPVEDERIECEQGLKATPPKSLTLLHTVSLPESEYCAAVCHYRGQTYIGWWGGGVHRIDANYQLTRSIIWNRKSYVGGVAVYKDRVYTLDCKNNFTVYVYSLEGKLINQWVHGDYSSGDCNKLAIVGDTLVILDRFNRIDCELTVYSLTGEILRQIACPLSSGRHCSGNYWTDPLNYAVALCAVGTDSVVVTDGGSSRVFRINTSSGEVMWSSKCITNPQGVAYDGHSYVIVTSYGSNKLWILDVRTGDMISEVAENGVSGSDYVFDLHISGDTLIVPRYRDRKVLFYQLNK